MNAEQDVFAGGERCLWLARADRAQLHGRTYSADRESPDGAIAVFRCQ